MTKSLPALNPSLARAFESERQSLRSGMRDADLSAAQIVAEARRALDRAGLTFTRSTEDPQLQKAGLWLIEMAKSGAGILDQGTGAEIIWHEVAPEKSGGWLGQGAFYTVGAGLAVYAYLETSRVALISIVVLTLVRLLDPANLKSLKNRLPFFKSVPKLDDGKGRHLKAEARITANIDGFLDGLMDSLKTADHIIMRLAEPSAQTHWSDDPRLLGLVQGLLEASSVDDGEFALKLIRQELKSVLRAEDIQAVDYSPAQADYFDILPGVGRKGMTPAAPALIKGDEVIRRGTVWGPDATL